MATKVVGIVGTGETRRFEQTIAINYFLTIASASGLGPQNEYPKTMVWLNNPERSHQTRPRASPALRRISRSNPLYFSSASKPTPASLIKETILLT
jgi:hypothetical protein